MRDFTIPAFILALPPLAALGHDIYLATQNTDLPLEQRFYLSDLGWLWKNYQESSYNWAIDNIDPGLWETIIDPLLHADAFYILSVPFGLFVLTILLMKIIGIGPYDGQGLLSGVGLTSHHKKDGFSFGGGGHKGRAKYKRK